MLTRQRGEAGSLSTWETVVERQTVGPRSPAGLFFSSLRVISKQACGK